MKKNNILKKLVLTAIALLLSCNISGLAVGINKSADTPRIPLSMQDIVYVNDDYNESTPGWGNTSFNTIQDGVDHVNISGTVIVYNGTYFESVIIKKTVRVIGERDNSSDPNYPPRVYDPTVAFLIIGNKASGTNISHFNITGGSVAGIMVLNSQSINISLNIISLNRRGVYLMSSSKCNITHNNVVKNTFMGISLENANHCNILWNWVVDNQAISTDYNTSGIDLVYSNNVNIRYNHMQNNGIYNIWIGRSHKTNNITANNIIDNSTIFEKKPITQRWYDSKNYWKFNYWSQWHPIFNDRPTIYLVWGKHVFGFDLAITICTFDIGVHTEMYPYVPNEP